MPELKVCGVTDAAFACAAARRGVDYLGFIFAEGSPRRVTVEQALEIADAVSELPTARLVGVFVSHAPSEIAAIASIPFEKIRAGAFAARSIHPAIIQSSSIIKII